MTKFQDPSFNSPANSNAYRDNFDKVFRRCKTEGCEGHQANGSSYCYSCMEKKGLLTEAPETD